MSTDLIMTTPHGFHSSCEVLNLLPTSLVSEMISSVIDRSTTTGQTFYEIYLQSPSPDVQFNLLSFEGGLSALQHINNTVTKYITPTPPSFDVESIRNLLKLKTCLTQNLIEIIINGYQDVLKTNKSGEVAFNLSQAFSLGKVIDFQWKIGLGISSDNCNNLSTPFITILLKIADVDGIKSYPIEMTIPQFKSFRASLNALSEAFHDA